MKWERTVLEQRAVFFPRKEVKQDLQILREQNGDVRTEIPEREARDHFRHIAGARFSKHSCSFTLCIS